MAGETAGSRRATGLLALPSLALVLLPGSPYSNSCLSLTFSVKLQLCKESGEGAGVCVKKKQREQSLILLPKSLSFFLLMECAIFKPRPPASACAAIALNTFE